MKMLSRFRKGKKSDGADSQAAADPDEEGLLMPAPLAQPSVDSGDDSLADVDAMPAAAESGGGGEGEASAAPAEDDELPAAAESGDGSGEGEASVVPSEDDDDLQATAQAPPAADEVNPEESADADAADDDPLSAFKVEEVHSDLTDLTKDIEEIEMTDLIEQLRDVRGMLPATSAEDEDAA